MGLSLELQTAGALSLRAEARMWHAIGEAVIREGKNRPREIMFFRVPPLPGDETRLLMHSDADMTPRPVRVPKQKPRGGKKGRKRAR